LSPSPFCLASGVGGLQMFLEVAATVTYSGDSKGHFKIQYITSVLFQALYRKTCELQGAAPCRKGDSLMTQIL
jgi:hypothetical protein